MPLISVHCLSSRMIEVQSQMSERAIELLALPEDTPCLILDIGLVLAPPTLHVTCLCYMFMLHVYAMQQVSFDLYSFFWQSCFICSHL